MKEKIKLVILIILFISLLVVVEGLLNNKNVSEDIKENDTQIQNQANTSIGENVTTSVISSYNTNETSSFFADVVEEEKTGKVIEVTEETFTKEVLKSNKKVLVEFYADWCDPCKMLAPTLEEIAKENPDIKVVKVNVDENQYTAIKYGAYSIPLLVVIEDGKEINSASGALPKEYILELIK